MDTKQGRAHEQWRSENKPSWAAIFFFHDRSWFSDGNSLVQCHLFCRRTAKDYAETCSSYAQHWKELRKKNFSMTARILGIVRKP
jgi:hypothetical protein